MSVHRNLQSDSENTQNSQKKPGQAITEKTTSRSGRRQLLGGLVAGGALTSTLLVPGKWTRPLVESVILPAHAQTSTLARVFSGNGILAVDAFPDGKAQQEQIADNLTSREHMDWLDFFIGKAKAVANRSDNGLVCAEESSPGSGLFAVRFGYEVAVAGSTSSLDLFEAADVPVDGNKHPLTRTGTLICQTFGTPQILLSALTTTSITVQIYLSNFLVLTKTLILGSCTLSTTTICTGTGQ